MTEGIILTPEGKQKLQQELEDLKRNKRRQVAERINTAKEFGDLSENAEYHDAKEEQAFIEGRIIELEHILKTAQIIKRSSSKTVSIGSVVSLIKDNDNFEVEIVGATEADPANGKISIDSPLGKILIDKSVDNEFDLETPGGVYHYKISKIK